MRMYVHRPAATVRRRSTSALPAAGWATDWETQDPKTAANPTTSLLRIALSKSEDIAQPQTPATMGATS
jgi:hypothetical protein